MQVEALLPLTEEYGEHAIASILTSYIAHSEDKNRTAQAIRQRFVGEVAYPMISNLPFSSDLQVGGYGVGRFGNCFLREHLRCCWTLKSQKPERPWREFSCLGLGSQSEKLDHHKPQKPSDIQALALLEILDPIREGAAKTLDYLRSQEVGLKIISGDNPVTVSSIAQKAGFADYQSYVDCSKITDEELMAKAEETAIFGRVSPHQKKLIIQTLKSRAYNSDDRGRSQ